MSQLGQKRRFASRPATSGLPRTKDIVRPPRHVSKVPNRKSSAYLLDHFVGAARHGRRNREAQPGAKNSQR